MSRPRAQSIADGRGSPAPLNVTSFTSARARALSMAVDDFGDLPTIVSKTPSPPKGLFGRFKKFDISEWTATYKEIDKEITSMVARYRDARTAENINTDIPQTIITEEEKNNFIVNLFNAAGLETIMDEEGYPLFNDVIYYIMKKYLYENIDIYTTRREPEYLILMAASKCTKTWLNSTHVRDSITSFKTELNEALESISNPPEQDDLEKLKNVILINGLVTGASIASILGEGFDISNKDVVKWDCSKCETCDIKCILTHKMLPNGIIETEGRYPGCGDFFKNETVKSVLESASKGEKKRTIYNSMRLLSAAGGKSKGFSKRKSKRKGRKTRSNRR